METIKKRKRKIFAPLTTSVTVACDSAFSPVTQVYNAEIQEYEPDRTVIATVLRPVVTANAVDGSWNDPYVNKLLADMHWFANGQDISTLDDWTGKYEISQVGAERGSLIIRRNVAPGERIDLHFEAVLPDPRIGFNIDIVSEVVCLSTTDKSTDSYAANPSHSVLCRNDTSRHCLIRKPTATLNFPELSILEGTDHTWSYRIPTMYCRGQCTTSHDCWQWFHKYRS